MKNADGESRCGLGHMKQPVTMKVSRSNTFAAARQQRTPQDALGILGASYAIDIATVDARHRA